MVGSIDADGYEIRLSGALDQRWSDWFQGIELAVAYTPDHTPITTILCHSTDQALLRGILNKLWDLNLSLLSVSQIMKPCSAGSHKQDE